MLPQQQFLWRNKQRILIDFYGCHSYWQIGLQKIPHRLSRKEKTTDHNLLCRKILTKIKIKFRNDQHSMFLTMLDSCELNNVFSTNCLSYIQTTQKTMLCLCMN